MAYAATRQAVHPAVQTPPAQQAHPILLLRVWRNAHQWPHPSTQPSPKGRGSGYPQASYSCAIRFTFLPFYSSTFNPKNHRLHRYARKGIANERITRIYQGQRMLPLSVESPTLSLPQQAACIANSAKSVQSVVCVSPAIPSFRRLIIHAKPTPGNNGHGMKHGKSLC